VSTNLLIPADGATVSGTTTVDASATGPLKGIDFRATGNGYSNVLLGAASATPWGWLYNWNTMDEPNGTYTLTSHVVDCAGNSISSAPITVTVANVATPYVAPPSPVVHLFGDSIFSQAASYFDVFYGLRGYAVAHNEWAGVAACDDFDQVATMPVPTVAVVSHTGCSGRSTTSGRETQQMARSYPIRDCDSASLSSWAQRCSARYGRWLTRAQSGQQSR
jgi:hypothetical protein